MVKSVVEYFNRTDRQTLRSVALMLGVIIFVIALLIYGRHVLGINQDDIFEPLKHVQESSWAFPVTACVFILAAFLGVPQWSLIAVSVIVFGPLYGAIYAWGASLLSALTGFVVAKYLGAKHLEAYRGQTIKRLVGLIRENGFGMSFLIRLVPSGPFVIVNMAAGISGMSLLVFLLGTALGIIPKIAVIALLGRGIDGTLADQKAVLAAVSFSLAAVCIAGMLWARRRIMSQTVADESPEIFTDRDQMTGKGT